MYIETLVRASTVKKQLLQSNKSDAPILGASALLDLILAMLLTLPSSHGATSLDDHPQSNT